MEGNGQSADPEEVKGLGDTPTVLTFRLDDESVIQLAVPNDALELARGPLPFPVSEPVAN
jgi:hypothetical protein